MKIHKRDSQRINTYFYNAVNKYGFDKFKWEVIDDTATSFEELETLEKHYIKLYGSFDNKDKGYNTQSGGNSLYEVTTEERENRSSRVKGSKNPMYGKPGTWTGKKFSKEHKANLSKSLSKVDRSYLNGGSNPSARKIVNLTTGEVFNTLTEAANKYSINRDTITAALRKEEKICCNCYWDYLENIDVNDIVLKIPDKKSLTKKRILCVEDNEVYNSTSKIALKLKCARKSIRDACNTGEPFRNKHYKYMY